MGTQRITARVWDREQSTNREYVLEFTASCGSVKVTSSAVIEAGQHMGYPVEDELVNEKIEFEGPIDSLRVIMELYSRVHAVYRAQEAD